MPLADELLGADTVAGLAACLVRAGDGITARETRACGAVLDGLSFTGRVALIRDAVLADLPPDYPDFATVLRAALRDGDFTGWMTFPVAEAVAVRGRDVFEPALALLAELTPRLTAETAVRPFLRDDPERALRVIKPWTAHLDPHVRRLASEGTRPRLPWAPRLPELIADPTPALPLLDALYRDDSEYVRRSVANHLNDISRDHPDLAVAVAARWLDDPAPTTDRVVRHGLRTLVKAGPRRGAHAARPLTGQPRRRRGAAPPRVGDPGGRPSGVRLLGDQHARPDRSPRRRLRRAPHEGQRDPHPQGLQADHAVPGSR
ncbi:DNA alkylation repair protein [Streptomyces lavendulocolor]|uniref:DNA alkylation repair protein n=1 Tax=Streptomyces lavendulocolor TaxID=67316 RepID=UPI0031E36DAF